MAPEHAIPEPGLRERLLDDGPGDGSRLALNRSSRRA
jgi:hypothetical protein